LTVGISCIKLLFIYLCRLSDTFIICFYCCHAYGE